jgi:hypothetical protein
VYRFVLAVLVSGLGLVPTARTEELSEAAQRGKKILETRVFSSASWSLKAYEDAWRQWGPDPEKPANYAEAFRQRYGLHPAPYDNGPYPMGIRVGTNVFGGQGLASDCLLCHGGSILGKSYIGLGNNTLDIQALFEEMARASGKSGKLPFTFSHVRGTSEAAGFAVFLLNYRNPDLTMRLVPEKIELHDNLCEDVPAWWLLKKKQTMYFTGTTPAKSVRSIMQFMLASTWGPEVFDREEAAFRDIQAYLLTLEAPRYPFPVDKKLAKQGEQVFRANCSSCHGTYGKNWSYPNKIIPLERIGTDRTRFEGIDPHWGHFYNRSWFAKEKNGWFSDGAPVTEPKGYQAPPLDGIWATAPYLHNGSVPTLYHLLNSKTRPAVFTRSYRTDANSYDRERVGWKVQVLDREASPELPALERRKIYDTRETGRGNGGHTFGDDLSEGERRAVIEYLKTL